MARVAKGPRGSKGSPVESPNKATRIKVKLSLSIEAHRVLGLEAFGRGVSLGQVVEELIRSSPRRFVLVDRGRGSQGTIGAEEPTAEGGQRAPGPPLALGVVSEAG